jgi:hypothetical protein
LAEREYGNTTDHGTAPIEDVTTGTTIGKKVLLLHPLAQFVPINWSLGGHDIMIG